MRSLLIWALCYAASAWGADVTDEALRKADPANWLSYNGSYDSRRHSLLKQIDLETVDRLTPKWVFHVPNASHLESVPVVVDGVMYVTQPNEVYALDGQSGRMIWDYHRKVARPKGPNRGVAVWGDKVYFTTTDAFLIALDAATGSVIWETKIAEASDGYWSPAAPLAVNGKIIAGIAPSDHGLNGFLDAYDAKTGKRIWRWKAIPKPGEPGSETWSGDSWKTGGGDTWLTGSYDPQTNLLLWGIGNPAPDFNGDVRKGDNLYTECMVALDADTGKLKWYFQFTPHDTMDWDSVEIPILIDAPFKGQTRKLLAHADRNGFYYLLDRASGKFLHGSPFVKMLNWATGLTEDGRPMRVPGVEPSLNGTKVCPAAAGATNWMSPAFNPDTGLFYVVAQESCAVATKATETFRPGGFQYRATGDAETRDDSWRMHVRALDLTTGKIVWDHEEVGAHGYGAGVLSTAGGLLFVGDDQGQFVALDARTGKPVWHFNVGQRISSSPMSYSYRGRQYIALTAASDVFSFGLLEPREKKTGAARYSAHEEPAAGPGSPPVIVLRDAKAAVEAAVAPSEGGELSSFRVRYRDEWIELVYRARDYSAAPGFRGKASFLWPAVGAQYPVGTLPETSCGEGTYEVEGKKYPMPCHGFAKGLPWRAESSGADSSGAWAALELVDSDRTRMYFPFGFRVRAPYLLSDGALKISYTVTASSQNRSPMMFSIGNHLALRVPFLNGTDAADMLLETPCATELLRNSRGVLSGEQRAQSLATPVRLGDFNAVTARSVGGYRGAPYARVTDPAGLGVRVNHTGITSGPEPLVQFNLYGGAKQGYLSPEPWFGIQNSLNTRRGVVTLEPGREWQWTIELVPEKK